MQYLTRRESYWLGVTIFCDPANHGLTCHQCIKKYKRKFCKKDIWYVYLAEVERGWYQARDTSLTDDYLTRMAVLNEKDETR